MKLRKFQWLQAVCIIALFFAPCAAQAGLTEIQGALLEKDFGRVENLSNELLAASPSKEIHHPALYYLALSQIQLTKYSEAEETLRQLIKENPSKALRDQSYLALFDVYFIKEEYPEALSIIEKLHRISSDSDFLSLMNLKLAKVSLKLSQWDKAKDYLQVIVTQFPHSMEVHTAKQLLEEKQFFAVQVGSFLERERAEKLASELKERGQYAYIIETADQQNQKLYRVRVGQLAQLNEARKLKQELARQGYPTQIFP